MPEKTIITTQPKNGKAATTVVQVVPQNQKKSNRNKKKRQNRRARRNRGLNSKRINETSFFKLALLAPDITGPVRVPRAASARTGLAIDVTNFGITGTGAATVDVVQATSIYTSAGAVKGWLAVTNSSTNIGVGSNYGPSSQFPSAGQIADVNLVACSIVAYYIGNPLNVSGEVLIGSTIPLAAGATFDGLWYYPGVIRFPVAELIQKPVRVSARKISPLADEFTATGLGTSDVDLPFIACTGLPTGGTIRLCITRTWEYRSTTATGSIIPYERVGESHVADTNAMQNARADIAQMPVPVTEAMPGKSMGSLSDYLGLGSMGLQLGAYGLGQHLVNQHLMRARGAQANRGFQPDNFIPFQDYLANMV